jgi:hypothetical protein
MPYTSWSAPVQPLNTASVSPAIAAAITDVSPSEVVLLPGMLNPGTRIRLYAHGEYTAAAGATATVVIGFYLNQVGTAIGTTPAILAASTANTSSASATAWPWSMWWNGRVIAVTGPADGANASYYGQGECKFPSSLTAWTISPVPLTAALRTVAQTATGGITTTAQKVIVATTWSATTNITSFTCDELTCELLG